MDLVDCTIFRAAIVILITLSEAASSGVIAQAQFQTKNVSAFRAGKAAHRSADQILQRFWRGICPNSGHRHMCQDRRLRNH